jgi:hypothetical protein
MTRMTDNQILMIGYDWLKPVAWLTISIQQQERTPASAVVGPSGYGQQIGPVICAYILCAQ